jgi:O-antigen/teichoic acid export membrane protein
VQTARRLTGGKYSDVEKGLVSDGAYVILGQIASATGALVGVRVLTEVLEPEVFGSVTLVTGVVALALGISSGGIMQAILRMYPECSRSGTLNLLRAASAETLRTVTLWLAGTVAIVCLAYSIATRGNAWSSVLVPGLLIIETARLYQTTLLNAARRQRLMASWTGSESWVRVVFAVGMVYLAGASTEAVLAGYFLGTVALWACFLKATKASGPGTDGTQSPGSCPVKRHEELQKMKAQSIRYAKPLVPLGVLGWLSGQADRYIIAGLLGLTSAGQYGAIYGLVSRPFLLAGASMELIFRQVLYESVSSDDLRQARGVLSEWLGIVGVFGVLGVVGFSIFHPRIAAILLAQPYRDGAYLMPWIAAGYCLLLFAQVIERVCYATKETGAVLVVQTAGAGSSILLSTIGVLRSGLFGAAIAVPCYFGLQLSVSVVVAYRAARSQLDRVAMAKK